jgi:hypothetical protein
MHETLAIVVRRGTRLSPAADAFVAGLTTHILGLGVGLEASKTST